MMGNITQHIHKFTDSIHKIKFTKSKMTSSSLTSFSLTSSSNSGLFNHPVYKAFLSINKNRRAHNTLKSVIGPFPIPNSANLTYLIEIHVLMVLHDIEFTKPGVNGILNRGCVLLVVKVMQHGVCIGEYVDEFSAHAKFANRDQIHFEEASTEHLLNLQREDKIQSISATLKVSGSMGIIAILPTQYVVQCHPDSSFMKDETPVIVRPAESILFFSKNGYNNPYSEAVKLALYAHLEMIGMRVDQFVDTMRQRQISTIVVEVMNKDEHVFSDANHKSFYVHGVKTSPGKSANIASLADLLPVVPTIYSRGVIENISSLIELFDAANVEGNEDEGWVVKITLRDETTHLIKFKFWWYLYMREFREVIKSNVEPTNDTFRYFGPEEDRILHLSVLRNWFWFTHSCVSAEEKDLIKNGRYIAIRDHFFASKFAKLDLATKFAKSAQIEQVDQSLLELVNQCEKMIVMFMTVGVQDSGKSTIRTKICSEFPVGLDLSQDDCNGDRRTLTSTIVDWTKTIQKGINFAFLDRCNFSREQRNAICYELATSDAPIMIVPINVKISDSSFESRNIALQRILHRQNHSFSKEIVGTLKIIETINYIHRHLTFPIDSTPEIASQLLMNSHIAPVTRFDPNAKTAKAGKAGKTATTAKAGKTSVQYSGIGVILDFDRYSSLMQSFPNIYGTHITLELGANFSKVVDEGTSVIVNIIGEYRNDKVCGLIVETGFKSINPIQHITLATATGVEPKMSNVALQDKSCCRMYDEVHTITGWFGTYLL